MVTGGFEARRFQVRDTQEESAGRDRFLYF